MSKMTDRVLKAQGLKSIRTQCEQITLKKNQRTLVVSSPTSEAIISSTILCKALLRFGGTFHITFVEPVIELSELNTIQKTYSAPTTLIIGVDVYGKKTIRKEKGYPIFIGGTHQSKQANIHRLGNKINIPSIAYILAEQKLGVASEELQLAAIGTLIRPKNTVDKVSKAIVKLAQEKTLVEERKGFKLFGSNSQPLMETLVYSIFPFLSNISGTPEIIEKIMDDADIPFSKRRTPISELSTEETQRLTKQLIPRLEQSVIQQVLGQDFALTKEHEDSPLRFLSSIRALTFHSWIKWKLGTMFSVWMGDRSRALRELVDSYAAHSKEVITGFHNFETSIKQTDVESESSEVISLHKIPGASNAILSDLGRISFEENLVNRNQILIITSNSGMGVVWESHEINLNKMLLDLKSVGLEPVSTSLKSIIIKKVSKEVRETLLRKLQTMTKGQ